MWRQLSCPPKLYSVALNILFLQPFITGNPYHTFWRNWALSARQPSLQMSLLRYSKNMWHARKSVAISENPIMILLGYYTAVITAWDWINFFFFSSVQSLSHVWLFVTQSTTARQASLSITNSWSPPKPMSIELVMPSKHLILCRPLLLLPSIFPSIRVFSDESALHIRWPKHWSFSFNMSPSSEHPGLISFRMD